MDQGQKKTQFQEIEDMTKYKTVLGDTWDSIAYKVYGQGKEKYAYYLMDANRDLLNEFIFSSGVEIICPDISEDNTDMPAAYPEWRT